MPPDVTPASAPAAPATPAPATPATPPPAAATDPQTPPAAPAKKSVLKPADAAPKDGSTAPTGQDGKPKGDDPAAAPYEVKVPEGVKLDEKKLGEFTTWAKERKLSPEQASDALAYWNEQQKAASQAWAKQGDDWYGELEKDQEFGGANLKASEAALQRALKRFDPKGELAAELERVGIENLPPLARFFARVGKAIGEDATRPAADAAAKPAPTDRKQKLASIYDHPDSQATRGTK